MVFLAFGVLLVALVLHLNVEDHILRECVLHLQVDLKSFVKLSFLVDDLGRVAFVHVGYQLENQSGCLDIALFLVRENNFALHYSRNSRLESHGERHALSWLNANLLLVNGEVTGSNQFNPVANWVLRRV